MRRDLAAVLWVEGLWVAGQIGLEATPEEYIATLVAVFREIRRVMRPDGVAFVNMGDSYCDKQLQMMPARVALALQADGWWVRSDIIWAKPNPMPESVTDRPTSAHEHVFLLSKRGSYFYDADAVREPHTEGTHSRGGLKDITDLMVKALTWNALPPTEHPMGRNMRNVWTIATEGFPEAHFATFPTELAERCIKAGSKPGDTVLDPFAGSGTVGLVCDRLQRNAVLIELSEPYGAMSQRRIVDDAPLFAWAARQEIPAQQVAA